MKKRKISAILLSVALLTGCQQAVTDNVYEQNSPAVQTTITTDYVDQHPIVTRQTIDINGDGILEEVQLILDEGDTLFNGTMFSGHFTLVLNDESGKLIDSLNLNPLNPYEYPKDFEIYFRDYNKDGVLDFTLKRNISYDMYSLNEDQELFKFQTWNDLGIDSNEDTPSIDLFTPVDGGFITQSIADRNMNDASVEHGKYFFDGLSITRRTYVYNDKAIDELPLEKFHNAFSNLQNLGTKANEKDYLVEAKDSYDYLLNHLSDVELYSLYYRPDMTDLDYFIYYKQKNLDSFKSILSNYSNHDYPTLEEMQTFKLPLENPDPEFYRVESIPYSNYTLVNGKFHGSKFLAAYDEKGDFLDCIIGHTYSDELLDVDIFENGFILVSPVGWDHGTGLTMEAAYVLELYENRFVEHLRFPANGSLQPPKDYDRSFELKGVDFDSNTLSILATYSADIMYTRLDGQESSSFPASTLYTIDENGHYFPRTYDYMDYTFNYIFTPEVSDGLFKANYNQLVTLVQRPDYDYKKDDLANVNSLIDDCSNSEEKYSILRLLSSIH